MPHRKSVRIVGNSLIIAIWLICLLLAAAMLSGCKTANPHPPNSPAWYQHEQLEESKRYRRQRWVRGCRYGRCG